MPAIAESRHASLSSPLYLASASPRRRELLGLLNYPFTVVVSRFDESTLQSLSDPVEFVTRAAEGKAFEVARRRSGIIIGVDTDVVSPDGKVLGKPSDADDACRMLRLLSGRTHQVHTGLCVVWPNSEGQLAKEVRTVRTDVTFATLSESSILSYAASSEPVDKAGAYGIQGKALSFVERIEGDLSSVIGLPLTVLAEILKPFEQIINAQDPLAPKPVRKIVE